LDGVANLISGFPEIQDLTFVPHKTLYRAIYPDYDIRVPHRDITGYINILKENFPQDTERIDGLSRGRRLLSHWYFPENQ